jgi:hypothetical protein
MIYSFVLVGLLIFLEGVDLIYLVGVLDLLELCLVRLYLLSKVLDSLGHVLRDAQVVLNALHRGARLGLLQSIGGERFVGIHQLLDLLLLQIDLGHLAVVVCELLIIIVVVWLLVLLERIDWSFFVRNVFSVRHRTRGLSLGIRLELAQV